MTATPTTLGVPITMRRFSGGFTLVELLVVISIIAVLIALLVPAISRAREQALRATCSSQLRQFMIALSSYDMAYKIYPNSHYGKGNAFYDPTFVPQYVAMKRDFGMTEKLINCPSLKATPIMTRSNGCDYRNDSNESVLYMGYMYLAGNGSHTEIAGPAATFINGYRGSDWPARSAGYYPTCGEVGGGSCKVVLPDKTQKQILPPSRQFIAHDYAFGPSTSLDIRWPRQSAHVDSQGFAAEGKNQLYQDGHVTWMQLKLGESWYAYGQMIWFNDPIPTGVSVIMVN